MKHKIGVIAAVSLFAMAAQSAFACGNNCGDDHDRGNDLPTRIVSVPNSNLNANSNNLGVGVGVDTAANANAAAKAKAEQQQGQQQQQTADSVTTVSNANSYSIPVQASPLPETMTLGGVTLQKVRDCGWRVKIKEFKNILQYPTVGGFVHRRVPVDTMAGLFDGYDTTDPLVKIEAKIGDRTVVSWQGQVLYAAVGLVSMGGGSSGAFDQAHGNAWSAGLALSSNGSVGQYGMVAYPCDYDAVKAGLVPPTVIEKIEKQGLILKKGVTRKATPAGTSFWYLAPGPIQKTETVNGVPVKPVK